MSGMLRKREVTPPKVNEKGFPTGDDYANTQLAKALWIALGNAGLPDNANRKKVSTYVAGFLFRNGFANRKGSERVR